MQAVTLPGGVKLLLLPDDRFASLQVKMWYAAPLQAKRITPAALLPLLLKRGNRKLPTQQLMVQALEELWGAEIQAGIATIGMGHVCYFELDLTDPRFLPGAGEAIIPRGIQLLVDLVSDPLLPGGSFAEKTFREEQQILLAAQERLPSSRAAYALDRCLYAVYQGEAPGINRLGLSHELKELTPQKMAEYYHIFRQESALTVGVTGAFRQQEMEQVVQGILGEHASRSLDITHAPTPHAPNPQQLTEILPGEQSQLVLAFTSQITYSDKLSLPLAFVNGLYGAYAHSRLFRFLREEAGLAYSVSSRIDRTHGTIYAMAGLSAENVVVAQEMMQGELASISKGNISLQELEMTRLAMLDQYRQLRDEPNSLLEFTYNGELLKRRQSLSEIMTAIRGIGIDDIAEAAAELRPHTSFILQESGDLC
ncbi:MAG: insulinase family protein [Symbiobacteriaceae bacterium]|nr:insulinase family protein [Symbiobacteriaceae bacterium]